MPLLLLEPEQTEQAMITRNEAIQLLLTDDELSDLTLRGSDGSLILAHRCMLAARSTVFRRMLFGGFCEASKSVVDVGYERDVLQAVVDFVYKDGDIALFEKPCSPDYIPTIVALVDAGNFLAIPELSRCAEQFVAASLKQNDSLAGDFLAACEFYGDAVFGIEEMALQSIRSNPHILVDKDSLRLLSSSQLEKVLKDDKLQAEEIALFMLIQLWSTSLVDSTTDPVVEFEMSLSESSSDLGVSGSRQKTAVELIDKYIHLDYIDPATLSTTIATSGLVSMEQLLEAYKSQALQAQKHSGLEWKKSRLCPVWKTSNDVVFETRTTGHSHDVIKCPQVLRSGIHKWRIRVEDESCNSYLGITYSSGNSGHETTTTGTAITTNQHRWIYGSNGRVFHMDGTNGPYPIERHPKFQSGATVTFILDMTGPGTLSASLDGTSNAIQLFGRLRSHLDKHQQGRNGYGGFVPSACLTGPGKIRFLGFHGIPNGSE